MDDGARTILAASKIINVPAADIAVQGARPALGRVCDGLQAQGIDRVYLHLDVDVLDASIARGNEFAPVGGLTPDDLVAAVQAIAERFTVAAAAVASYDPGYDRADRVLETILRTLEAISTAHAARGMQPT